jgi:hypothetical protein
MPPIVQHLKTGPEERSGFARASIRPGQTTPVTVTLKPSAAIARKFVIHFSFDKAFVEPCLRPVLRQVAAYARQRPQDKLVIIGNSDLAEPPKYNQSLSERRARAVFAMLTFGRAQDASVAEWNLLRQPAAGELPTGKDTWGVREYQQILQDLGYYSGKIYGGHDGATKAAVQMLQKDKGLSSVDGVVGDETWLALIQAYLKQDALSVPESQFFPNCPGEILKWLGHGDQDPIKNIPNVWRPNRRTELLFVHASALPCRVPPPDTFAGNWCLGPGHQAHRACFLTRGTQEPNKWLVRPAEEGSFYAQGSIRFEDDLPLAHHDDLHPKDPQKPRLGSETAKGKIFKTIRLPLELFTNQNPALSLAAIHKIVFEFRVKPSGEITIDSIEFSQ